MRDEYKDKVAAIVKQLREMEEDAGQSINHMQTVAVEFAMNNREDMSTTLAGVNSEIQDLRWHWRFVAQSIETLVDTFESEGGE
jgi:hypothetical protein